MLPFPTDRRTLLLVVRMFLLHFTERVQARNYDTDFSWLPGDLDFEELTHQPRDGRDPG